MNDENEVAPVVEDELTSLKSRADKMGLTYHPTIGLDKLREKLNAALEPDPEDPPATPVPAPAPAKETDHQRRLRKKKEATKLVRLRVTCMNPNKREWEGEFFTAGNSLIGSFGKYVAFEVDYHVPAIIYNQIKQRKCQVFYTETGPRGMSSRKGKLINEFAIEILPDLNQKELRELAQRQAMASGTSEEA